MEKRSFEEKKKMVIDFIRREIQPNVLNPKNEGLNNLAVQETDEIWYYKFTNEIQKLNVKQFIFFLEKVINFCPLSILERARGNVL